TKPPYSHRLDKQFSEYINFCVSLKRPQVFFINKCFNVTSAATKFLPKVANTSIIFNYMKTVFLMTFKDFFLFISTTSCIRWPASI
ncbi:hypothetical protein OFM41_25500, partial [Escherichia coli]|nr:hypothetical protein [Escherichia coli]